MKLNGNIIVKEEDSIAIAMRGGVIAEVAWKIV
jgi:hypothetical protein